MCVSHQNRINPVIFFSSEKKSPGDLAWEESQEETRPYFWEYSQCHHALSSGSHGRGWVVSWEEIVQYGVPRERETQRPESVMSIHKMLLWVEHEPVDLVFFRWDTELMRVWMLLRVLLVRGWALPRSLCYVGSVEMAASSLGFGQDSSFPMPLGKGGLRPISALISLEPVLVKLQSALDYLGRCR